MNYYETVLGVTPPAVGGFLVPEKKHHSSSIEPWACNPGLKLFEVWDLRVTPLCQLSGCVNKYTYNSRGSSLN